ncbi:MAG: alpha/beta hydrolase-fold protein, partial [Rhodothermales bacterium]|nr:alpha/beta hydrolase-fold protein [Rhodothermales bacterium]
YPDEFGVLLVASPSVWWDDQVILREVEALERKTAQRIWVDMGTAEGNGMLQGARRLREALEAQGWTEGDDLRYVEEDGAAHNERAWAGRFGSMLQFAFPAPK